MTVITQQSGQRLYNPRSVVCALSDNQLSKLLGQLRKNMIPYSAMLKKQI